MKLLSALGESYDIIMEMVDFLNGNFAYGENGRKIKESFAEPLDEIVLLFTTKTLTTFKDLKKILQTEYPPIMLTGIDLEVPDITTAGDDEKIRDKVFSAIEQRQSSRLLLSSAGRKDITQGIIEAGYLYGFYGYLSVTLPPEINQLRETNKGLKDYQILRRHPECLIVNWYPLSALLRRRHRLPETVYTDTRCNTDEGTHQTEPELIQNFSSLYSLPLMLIQRLKTEKIGADRKNEQRDYRWLRALPKTDLHCHFGGAAGPEELKIIAEAILADNLVYERWRGEIQSLEKKLRNCSLEEELYKKKGATQKHPLHYLKEYYEKTAPELPVSLINVVQLSILSVEEISHLMWFVPDPPYSYGEETDTDRLTVYTDTGNFGGSLLLQTKVALETAMHCLLNASVKDNIRYIEVRISPMNYCQKNLNASDVMNILLETSARFIQEHPSITVNFVIIATRSKEMDVIRENIKTAIAFFKDTYLFKEGRRHDAIRVPRVCGVDLAGKEEGFNPSQFKDLFEPLHRDFIKITIHAGETEGSHNIWEALYLLHANRIGHGLKLYQDENMMEYLRDFHISLEMCPTSNRRICRYRDFSDTHRNSPENAPDAEYPLHRYLKEGVAVTINTDNRGFSQTDLTGEYLEASYLTEGGLSKWEILKIIREGFLAGFLPLRQKNRLLHQAERDVLSFLIEDYLEKNSFSRKRN